MRRLTALAIGVLSMIWLAAPALAESPSVHVSPHTVAAGGTVRVSGGTCVPHTTSGEVMSHAFFDDHASHDFAGLGAVRFSTNTGDFSVTALVPAGTAPGSYQVLGRCGGARIDGTTLTVTAAAGSAPTAVPAGTGGLAATGRSAQPLLFGGAGLLVLVAGGALLLVRRRHRPVG